MSRGSGPEAVGSLAVRRGIIGGDLAVLAAVALPLALAHAVFIEQYGIFRDELYYIACSKRLAWGYVDQPPLAAALLRMMRALFGDSLAAVRALSIVLGVLTVFATGALARRLGGRRFAQGLAALAVAAAPHFLYTFHYYSMNAAEVFLWTLAAYLLVRALEDRAPWVWLAFGLVCGLGLLSKIGMGVFGLGLAIGLLLTRERRVLLTPWPWLAAAIGTLLFAPHVLWQVQNGWPTREFVENAQRDKIAAVSAPAFLREVVLMMNPVSLPVWVAGLWGLFRCGARGRVLGWACLVVFAVFFAQHSKPYYVTPVFPVLFAAGGVAIERWTRSRAAVRVAALGAVGLGGILLAPFALPSLPVERFIAYQDALGIRPSSAERQELAELPQHYADMFGWEELARAVSQAYLSLPESERATARAWAGNYGEAGAIEYFRGKYPLPPVLCPHNNYWFWGPGEDGGTLIVIGGDEEDHADSFQRVELAGRARARYCMPYERDLPIWVCRGWTVSLNAIWAGERRFI